MSTVLVVQRDATLSEAWSLAAEASGHTVICAEAIRDGIRRVREGGLDVILVDHGDRDGGLTEFVNEIERLPDPPPFVLVSDSPRAPEISAHLGAAAFLPKPCSAAEIVAILDRFGAIPIRGFVEDEPTEPRREPLGSIPG